MEEWHERGSDCSRGFRGIFDIELARFGALAYDCLEDRPHPLDTRLDDRLVLLRGGDDQLVHGPCLDQHHLVVVVNSGQELAEFLCGRRVSARDRGSDVGNLVHNTPADGLVDRIPGGKETVDVGRAHAELSGDVGHRGPMVTHAAKLFLRCFQDPPAGSESFPVRTGRFIELTELYSAANAGRNSGSSVEF